MYNNTKRKAMNKFKTQEGKRISNLAKKDPKNFWKEMKKHYKKNKATSDKLTADDFLSHFEIKKCP